MAKFGGVLSSSSDIMIYNCLFKQNVGCDGGALIPLIQVDL